MYMGFGTYATDKNVKSRINLLYIVLMASMACWACAFSVMVSAPTPEESVFWGCLSVFGWGIFYSILLHFVILLTRTKFRLNKFIVLTIIYLPAVINILLFAPFGFLAEKQFQMVKTDIGWLNILPVNAGNIWYITYYLVFTFVLFLLLIRWWRKLEPNDPQKRQAAYFLLSLCFPLVMGISTETIPDILGKGPLPELTVVYLMVPVAMLFSTLRKSGLLLEKPVVVSVSLKSNQLADADRFRMFRTVASIFITGSSVSFFIGYFAMKRTSVDELLLSGALLSLGLFIRIIPRITKNHTTQNTLFLIAGALSLFYLMQRNVETGAVTIWSIYILFFMFTVILDSKIHLTIYTGLVILIQIAFLIFYPDVTVIIDANAYLTRVALVILTYFAVRQLANEYTIKLEAHKKLIKEQQVIETISTSFITVSSENVRHKVDNMLEMSAEVLDFDYAYLIKFSAGYEDANVLSTYSKNNESDSLPYHPGMKLKTADLPLAKALIERGTPLKCEDIINNPLNTCEGTRNFLITRGINSFFAFPLQIEEQIEAMLVFEYYDGSNKNVSENRSYFFNMLINILRDSRKKTLYEKMIYDVAYFDETTKLANRSMFIKTLEECISDKKETGKIAVLNIELSNMRMIKDTYGHNMVEQVMLKSAAILKDLLSTSCTLARTNDGEFAVLLPDVESTERIEACANRLIAAFSNPISTDLEIEALFVVPRIGVSVYPDDGKDVRTIIKNADLAGYEAIRNNEDVVFYANQLEDHIAENTLLTNRLFKSLQNEEFFLEFQPQISCETEKTTGIEALLRWTTDGRRVPPDRFIPILEQTGLIYDVGLWVLKQALKEHNRLISKGFAPIRISVNLSVVQFENDDFISDFAKVIEESRVDPKYIEMEITESLFSKDPEDVIKKLYALKGLGVRLSIDDFGRGYSTLSRLKMVPFDRLKIDKEIIDFIDSGGEGAQLTENIVSMARIFKANVTAEGVETKEQADFLKSIICDEIQGYYYSKPLSPQALEEFLKEESA